MLLLLATSGRGTVLLPLGSRAARATITRRMLRGRSISRVSISPGRSPPHHQLQPPACLVRRSWQAQQPRPRWTAAPPRTTTPAAVVSPSSSSPLGWSCRAARRRGLAACGAAADREAAAHLDGLNPEQREAVLSPAGAATVVMAGPGSGKTRAITARVAHLVHDLHVPPQRVLVITFTRKAARELKERLSSLMPGVSSTPQGNGRGASASSLHTGTFHSVAATLLRKYLPLEPSLGRSASFLVADDKDTKDMLRSIMKDLLAESGSAKAKVDPEALKRILSAMGKIKNKVWDPAMTGHEAAAKLKSAAPLHFAAVWDRYEATKREADMLDFDDLIGCLVAILLRNPKAMSYAMQKYDHVLVDEFQDTNLVQYALCRILTRSTGNLFVVGDVDQAIYAFRGALPRIMSERLYKDFPNLNTVLLSKNYRSTSHILSAADGVIASSRSRSPLRLECVEGHGNKVTVLQCGNEKHQAAGLVAHMQKLMGAHPNLPLSEISVLFRYHADSRPVEERLIDKGIPYVLVGGTPFYGREEVKDCLAYLKVITNHNDSAALRRIINKPARGIGATTLKRLEGWSADHGLTLGTALFELDHVFDSLVEQNVVAKRASQRVQSFVELIRACRKETQRACSVADALRFVVERIKMKEHLIKPKEEEDEQDVDEKARAAKLRDEEEGKERWRNVTSLINKAEELHLASRRQDNAEAIQHPLGPAGAEIVKLLEEVTLFMQEVDDEDTVDRVRVTTIHQSKGLEFDACFIIGCEKGHFPRGSKADKEWDEECRLMYVAVTRARKYLYVLYSEARMQYGQFVETGASGFVESILESLCDSNGLRLFNSRGDEVAPVPNHKPTRARSARRLSTLGGELGGRSLKKSGRPRRQSEGAAPSARRQRAGKGSSFSSSSAQAGELEDLRQRLLNGQLKDSSRSRSTGPSERITRRTSRAPRDARTQRGFRRSSGPQPYHDIDQEPPYPF